MRVLFVSGSFPSDPEILTHGVYKRMGTFIEAIKEIAELDLLFYVWPGVDVSPAAVSGVERSLSDQWGADLKLFLRPRSSNGNQLSKWTRYGSSALNFYRQGVYSFASGPQQVQAFETCLRRKPDAILAHRLVSMCPALLTREILPPVFFDLDDIEHISLVRSTRLLAKWRSKTLYYSRLPALLWGEQRAIRLARRTFVCSDSDRRYLANRWHCPRVVTVPNAVAIPPLQPLTSEPTLLFLGSYLYKPNAEAAEFLIGRVWPRVHQAMPTARLIIAGRHPERVRGYDGNVPGVEFPGFIDDIGALYQKVRVVCAPIFSGAGTRIKIIEAAAYGKPLVATRLGAEGIQMRDNHELLIRDDPASFAEACLTLLKDPDHCRRLGAAAREAAVRDYDKTQAIRLIQGHLTS